MWAAAAALGQMAVNWWPIACPAALNNGKPEASTDTLTVHALPAIHLSTHVETLLISNRTADVTSSARTSWHEQATGLYFHDNYRY
ncbi:unnamed protein product [Heligmosomoides polygyrus]|uniref:Secreted protein n=1 Tax=Heligmosomoides polygyrus TaxID=6339 RepID=A0A183G8U0_HELPZ|nr:unnamed protein product [Heligmosomoides polygyrus]